MCADIAVARALVLPWETLFAQRSIARFRAGLLELCPKEGMRTAARVSSCVACSNRIVCPSVHCIANCPSFSSERARVLEVMGVSDSVRRYDFALAVARISPGTGGYVECAKLLYSIDCAATLFWREHGH